MKKFIFISAVLSSIAMFSLYCTNVEFDNVLDPVSSNYVGDSAAADDDNNDTANYYEPGHPMFGDKKPPVIILVPDTDPASITVHDQKALEKYMRGYKASDDMDKDINQKVNVESDVDLMKPGEYTITYSATDRAGNNTSISRSVIVVPENVVDKEPPNISVSNEDTIWLYEGQEYKEYGATATDYPDGDLTKKIDTIGSVDTDVVGTYEITYTVEDNAGNSASATRIVIVEEDNSGPGVVTPTVTLNGSKDTMFTVGGTYIELGVTATDNNGPIDPANIDTTRIPNFDPGQPIYEPGTYKIMYTAKNEAGSSNKTRTLIVLGDCEDDITPPEITLAGGDTVEHPLGSDWDDPGWSVYDDEDGSNAIKLPVEGTVDVNTEGTYTLTYKAVDLCNNESTATRTVKVVGTSADAPVITILGDDPDTITVGTTYDDPGATAVPDVEVTVKSTTVDESTPGEYIIEYSATNDGEEGTATRTVVVVSGGGSGGDDLLSKYEVPRSTGLDGFNQSFSNVTTEGEGGPNLDGRTLTVNFDQWGFHQISLDNPWIELKDNQTNNFTEPDPMITITSSEIPNLDGEYYVNYIDEDFIMVRTDGSYAIIAKQ
ncbi:MAG: immunoglobulin-like domain-containing protein [Chitinispirillaceae bacterium]